MTNHEHPTERILALLKEAATLERAGKPVGAILRQLGISEETYLEWRGEEEAEDTGAHEVIEELKRENGHLHEVVENLSLDAGISKEAFGGDFQ